MNTPKHSLKFERSHTMGGNCHCDYVRVKMRRRFSQLVRSNLAFPVDSVIAIINQIRNQSHIFRYKEVYSVIIELILTYLTG